MTARARAPHVTAACAECGDRLGRIAARKWRHLRPNPDGSSRTHRPRPVRRGHEGEIIRVKLRDGVYAIARDDRVLGWILEAPRSSSVGRWRYLVGNARSLPYPTLRDAAAALVEAHDVHGARR